MYDWANSVYSLTITTAVFPIYFSAVTTKEGYVNSDGQNLVTFLGFELPNSVLYSYALSFAFLSIALINPLLSGIADYSGKKKSFMQFFAFLGAISCSMLYFFNSQTLWIGVLFFILATIGYAGSLVFYNAYLPEIATPDQYDRVSAKGFSMGYIGSVLLLVVNIAMIQLFPEPPGMAARLSFLSVGVWWAVFAIYTFMNLPAGNSVVKDRNGESYLSKGYQEIKRVFSEVVKEKSIRNFLIAFFFYSMSFQTIMYLASIFGSEELHIPESGLILTILIIQLVAIAGAYLFSICSKKYGNVVTLLLALGLCIVVCIAAYYVATAEQFYVLAFLVGLIMGGIQSLSRSTYSKLLPETKDHASYFSFYELTDKVGTALGTAIYGLIAALTGSMRNSIFALIVFFIIGILFLNTLRKIVLLCIELVLPLLRFRAFK